MIDSKKSLNEYLLADKRALHKENKKSPSFFSDEIWKYQIFLRKYEFYLNTKGGLWHNLKKVYFHYRWHTLGVKLGFMVPPNVFGKGLRIVHYGLLTVNKDARIGENCIIQEGVKVPK